MGRNIVIAAVSALIFASNASATLRLDVDMDLANWGSDGLKPLRAYHHLVFIENDDQIGEVINFSFNSQSGAFEISRNSLHFNLDGSYHEDSYYGAADFSNELDLSSFYVDHKVALGASFGIQTSSTANRLYADYEDMDFWNHGRGFLRIWASHTDDTVGSAGFDNPLTINEAIPEPASWAMMLAGFGLICGAMRCRRKAAVRFTDAFFR